LKKKASPLRHWSWSFDWENRVEERDYEITKATSAEITKSLAEIIIGVGSRNGKNTTLSSDF